jgi:3-deoxy-manno-octulosonate cytidylyltransferase (CMP-KDO synthetase)
MIVFIPVRLGSSRLPQKVIADVGGLPMMIQVGKRAKEADVGPVCFACAEQELVDLAKDHGFDAVLTDPNLASGTDRMYAGFKAHGVDSQHVINVQGDMPFVDPAAITATAKKLLSGTKADIVTPITPIQDPHMLAKISMVKVVVGMNGHAIYFTRTPNFPNGEGIHYGHLGIYGYKISSLERFVSLPRSPLEIRESLEQLRALEDGMRIEVVVVNHYPQSVDTPEDLEKARLLVS